MVQTAVVGAAVVGAAAAVGAAVVVGVVPAAAEFVQDFDACFY